MKNIIERNNLRETDLEQGVRLEESREPYHVDVAKFWDADDFDEYEEFLEWKLRQGEIRNRRFRIAE